MIAKESILIKEFSRSNQPILIICQSPVSIINQVREALSLTDESISFFSKEEGVLLLRERIRDLYARPLSSKYKFFYITDCDSLSVEESNTILKLTEEPPSYLRILLVAKNESKVLPTIKSRAKKFVLNGPDKIHDSELGFFNLMHQGFSDFSNEISKLERSDFTNLLLQGIEEDRKNLLNKKALERYKMMVASLVKVDTTNVNFRLVAEELYLFCNK